MYVQKMPEWLRDSANSGQLGTSYDRTLGSKHRLEVRNTTSQGALDTTAHELQHLVQEQEGFNTGAVQSDYWKEAADIIDKNPKNKNLSEKERRDAVFELAFKMYRQKFGEVEARATAARRQMTAAERRQTFPEASFDIPVSEIRLK